MKLRSLSITLASLALLVGADLSMAYEHQADRPAEAVGKVGSAAKTTTANKTPIDARRKSAAKTKLVDINNASKTALKKLPGITEIEAEKIVAGRPYGSKTWLVTNQVISPAVYAGIKQRIEARQPYGDAASNAAIYERKNKH